MRIKPSTKLVHEGDYVTEVDVELVETDTGWSPYLSLDDARKLCSCCLLSEATSAPSREPLPCPTSPPSAPA
jgi:hypothetical protein